MKITNIEMTVPESSYRLYTILTSIVVCLEWKCKL